MLSELYKMMNIIQDQDDLTIYDPTSIDFSEFEFTSGYYPHKISKQEIVKPGLISNLYFNKPDYTYFILRVNQIVDIDELIPNTEIRIPKEEDIQLFILNNRKR